MFNSLALRCCQLRSSCQDQSRHLSFQMMIVVVLEHYLCQCKYRQALRIGVESRKRRLAPSFPLHLQVVTYHKMVASCRIEQLSLCIHMYTSCYCNLEIYKWCRLA